MVECIRNTSWINEGEQVANPVSITKEQRGQTVHFLDMEILRSTPGVSQSRMHDKRDHMETLKQYRRYPHILKHDYQKSVCMRPSTANFVDLQ